MEGIRGVVEVEVAAVGVEVVVVEAVVVVDDPVMAVEGVVDQATTTSPKTPPHNFDLRKQSRLIPSIRLQYQI
jgi:hypothetical protein